MKNANKSAFPSMSEGEYQIGLTKREVAALMAMQGILANQITMEAIRQSSADRDGAISVEQGVSIVAHAYADAMIMEVEDE